MSETPPSYEEATSQDPWKIILVHISPRNLKALSLVSKSIGKQVTGLLWANPAELFGEDDEEIYRKL